MKRWSRHRAATLSVLLLFMPCLFLSGGGFRDATAGYEYQFPRDHGSHPDTRTEWWYYTGHLQTEKGRRYGFEVTFFRVGMIPPGTATANAWEVRSVMPAHFALTDLNAREFRYYEKLNRASPFTANARIDRLSVFNEGWSATTNKDGSWQLIAAAGKDSLALTLRARKPPVIHGVNGISVKAAGPGYASHYYSMTRLDAEGSVNGQAATGEAWMDHEFGSAALRETQVGWDWFSVQLDDETEVMLYVIRRSDGTPDVTSSGSVVASDGRVIHIARDQFRVTPLGRWRSPKSRAVYPMGWRVEVLPLKISLTLQPLLREQELVTGGSTRVTYWEGAVSASGSSSGSPVTGKGYVEMTGYDRAFRMGR